MAAAIEPSNYYDGRRWETKRFGNKKNRQTTEINARLTKK